MAYWGNDPRWTGLTPAQRAAAMALMEAGIGRDGIRFEDARHVLGAEINRAQSEGSDLGQSINHPGTYQPLSEGSQLGRLDQIVGSPGFQTLTDIAERRLSGDMPDEVQGATHFLAPESQMLALEAKHPAEYKNWGPRGRNWTGYDPNTGSYANVVMRDSSHAFLRPGGGQTAMGLGAPAAPPPPPNNGSLYGRQDVGPPPEASTAASSTPVAAPAPARSTDWVEGPLGLMPRWSDGSTALQPLGFASGGIGRSFGYNDGATNEPIHAGPLRSADGGRTDTLPVSVKPGSYVMPADIVSALGENNSEAGHRVIDALFRAPHRGRMQTAPITRAQGGKVPIMAAGGEDVLEPEYVAAAGGGDPEHGYRVLDNFVKKVRKHQIKTLAKLPPPAR